MKVNLNGTDLDKVGVIRGRNSYHNTCYPIFLNNNWIAQYNAHRHTSPIFRKTAREYQLKCSICGFALAN